MRTQTAAHTAVLANPDRSTYVRVKVYDGASWIDLTSHKGRDWLVSVDYGETQEGRVMDASFVVYLADHDLNMSPLMTSSHCNDPNVVLDIGNDVLIDAAVMPLGVPPASGDWMNVFDGQIDAYTIGKDTVTCKCFDQGQQLADAFIETEKDEYADGSTDVSAVIQAILDDWPNTPDGANVTLWSESGVAGTEFGDGTGGTSDDRPGWNITRYRQKRQPILDAITLLAKMIGHDLRYRWQVNSAAFELMMWEPDRDASGGVDYTFGTDEILSVGSVSLSRRNIRNVVDVLYTDSDGNRQKSTDTDAASIAKYGRRWCELAEGEASQIDTSTEADILSAAAVDDMAEPTAKVSFTVPFFPWAQLQDYYTVTANNFQFEANQSLAVIGVRHRLSKDSSVTTLTVEGKPRVGKAKYLMRQQQRNDRVLDNTNVVTIASVETNLCPNGSLGGYDAG